jgi:hypothetical protein
MSQSNDGKPAALWHDSLFRGRFQRLLIALGHGFGREDG